MKKKSGAGFDEIYVSPWFAYKHLLFTADSVTPRETIETSTAEKKDTQAEVFNRESSATSQSTCMSEDEHDFTLPSIRKKRNVEIKKIDDKDEEASKFMKKATEELTQKDEFTIYGQLIAHKIRNLNPLNRLLAQQRINNILFNLEMQQMTGAAATQNRYNKTEKMGNIVFSIIWFIILIFVSFWVAGICAGIYIIVLPFTVCVEALSGLTDFLLSVIQFPRYCAQAMMEGRGLN
ncbi:hypothetical protein PYW07_006324 [Mythimna separata]|uniref:Uncharacterized protein n=1 Tax=Mythimna separata TaxID=271217 RepID=A0AAD8DWM7_MYTSE|nr:hypothetical protein PYW07_006324 [Mythimna separata]